MYQEHMFVYFSKFLEVLEFCDFWEDEFKLSLLLDYDHFSAKLGKEEEATAECDNYIRSAMR